MDTTDSIFETIPPELLEIILQFIQKIDITPASVQNFSMIYFFPQDYRAAFLCADLRRRTYNQCYCAHLMLTAVSYDSLDFARNILIEVFKFSGADRYSRELFEKSFVNKNMFFLKKLHYYHTLEFQIALFHAALYSNRVAILRQMDPSLPDNLGQLLCHFSQKFHCLCSENHLARLALNGDIDTLQFIYSQCQSYRTNFTNDDTYYFIMTNAMYGAHLDLVNWLLELKSRQNMESFRKKLIRCLLRTNHLEQVTLLMVNPKYQLAFGKIKMHNAFYISIKPSLVKMKVTLRTYEFCLQHLGNPTRDLSHYKKIFSDAIHIRMNE